MISLFFLATWLVYIASSSNPCTGGSQCEVRPGVFETCPFENGVCCDDNKHCCPQGTVCDTILNRCRVDDKALFSLTSLTGCFNDRTSLIPVTGPSAPARAVICEDRNTTCPEGTTCCQMGPDNWGCCEYAAAVCCSDQLHCCPHGYSCDVAQSNCVPDGPTSAFVNRLISLLSRMPVLRDAYEVGSPLPRMSYETEMCDDGRHECPRGTSCCPTASGAYACCPMPAAVCCSDGIHCCPENTQCDISSGRCVGSSKAMVALTEKQTAVAPAVQLGEQLCPDAKSRCPDSHSCCLLKDGSWGCCPVPEAVCCDDGLHCCPKGFKCNFDRGMCIKESGVSSPTGPEERDDSPHACPDPSWECRNGTTCCPLGNEEWGCCGLPNAVCCDDGAHCCPESYRCDIEHGQCVKLGTSSISRNAIEATLKRLRCTDPSYHCPEYTRCDSRTGECVPDTRGAFSWYTKIPARRTDVPVEPPTPHNLINCPNSDWQCPEGSTCCQLDAETWSCCPVPNAVCCSDHAHCCPDGYECAVGVQACVLKRNRLPPAAMPSVPRDQGETVCPDQRSYCVDQQSCCPLIDGDFGCCPLANGTCCPDRKHCCPSDTVCADEPGECVRHARPGLRSVRIAAHRMTPNSHVPTALAANSHPRTRLTGQSVRAGWCSGCEASDEYCCPNAVGLNDRMCCPQAGSMCCPDGLYCCPPGTRCSSNGQCEPVNEDRFLAPFLIPSKRIGTKQLSSPSSTPSSVQSAKSRRALVDPRLRLRYFREYKSARWNVCPDHIRACHLDEQCCPSAGHGFVCAPKTAVCCSPTSNFYCPAGSSCSPDGLTCRAVAGA